MPDLQKLPRTLRGRGHAAVAALFAATVLAAAAPSPVARSEQSAVAPASDTPVADAAMRGDSAKLRMLLKQGVDANAAQADGMTALHWASARGDAPAVRVLVLAGARLEATTRNGSYTPLHLAAQAGRGATVRALLEAGANANSVTTSGGATPLHLAAGQGNIDAVNALLEHKATVDARESDWSQTPLMWAATYDRVPAIEALLAHGANIEATSKVENLAEREKADRASNALRTRKVLALKSAESAPALPAAGAPRAGGAGTPTAPAGTSNVAPVAPAPAGRGNAAPPPASSGAAGAGVAPPSSTGPVTVLAAETAAAGIPPGNDAAKLAAAATTGKKDDKKDSNKKNDKKAKGDVAKAVTVNATDSALAAAAPKPISATAAAAPAAAGGRGGRSGGGSVGDTSASATGFGRGMSYGDLVGNKGGLTPLLFAVRQGNTASVKALLKAGAKINHVSEGDHTSPLLMATINGQFDLAKMLLAEAKADPKLASDAGATPLYAVINVQWAAKSLYPQPTAQYQQGTTYLDLMEALIKAGADVNARLSKHLWYMSYNFDLLGVNTTGATPFWRAAYGTDVDAMKLLVKYGADPKIPTLKPAGPQRDQDGAIVEEGAGNDPSGLPPVPAGGPGVYPIHAASGVGYGDGFAANAHRHAPDGWLPSVKYLVEDLKLDVNARDFNGYNALHNAAARGDTLLAAYLVSKGGDIHAISRKGQTVADMANGPVQRVPPFSEAVVFLEKLGSKNSNKCKSC